MLRAEPDGLEQLAARAADRPSRSAVDHEGLADDLPTVFRGFSDEYGSWKIICISRRSGRSCALREARDVLALEPDRPGGRVEEAEDQPSSRRLAAAGLADDPERLAAAHVSETSSTACTSDLPRAKTPC